MLNLMCLISLYFVLGILKNYENFPDVHFLFNELVKSRQLLHLACGQNALFQHLAEERTCGLIVA